MRVCGVHLDRFLLKSQLATRDAIYGDDCTFNLARERGGENGGTIYIFRLPPTATDARMRWWILHLWAHKSSCGSVKQPRSTAPSKQSNECREFQVTNWWFTTIQDVFTSWHGTISFLFMAHKKQTTGDKMISFRPDKKKGPSTWAGSKSDAEGILAIDVQNHFQTGCSLSYANALNSLQLK